MADFSRAEFSKNIDFSNTKFSADANFSKVVFIGWVQFRVVLFNATVNFQETRFIEQDGSRDDGPISDNQATSTDVLVKNDVEPTEVTFAGATFKDGVRFESNEFADRVFMSFDSAIFEKPDRATFHTKITPLRPHWFINVDPRKFTFTNVDWGFLSRREAIRKEIAALESSGKGDLKRLLRITFQQLAVNAEDNNRYEEAANFRYLAMDVKRLLKWRDVNPLQRWRKVDLFSLSWWYWLLSGYGERVPRAFGALLSILLLFAVIYWVGGAAWWQPKQTSIIASKESRDQNETTVPKSLGFTEALVYSAAVMALQKPEPLPANKRAKTFVLFETVLGPLQAALLALAIRRKFMR